MNFIKNNSKVIIGILIGIIIGAISVITVYATIGANTVDYTNDKKVSDALNDLYNISSDYVLPSGTENITANGDYDVTNKASVSVNVNSTTVQKTLLWSNPDSSVDFAAQDITLSQSLSNFSHILIQYTTIKTDTTIYDNLFKILPKRLASQASNGRFTIGCSYSNAEGFYTRNISCVDNNNSKLRIGVAIRSDLVNSTERLIPVSVYGLNFSY